MERVDGSSPRSSDSDEADGEPAEENDAEAYVGDWVPPPEPEPDLEAEKLRWPRGREFTKDEVGEILEAHQEWRQSKGESGGRGDLSYGNFVLQNAPRLWLPYGNLRGSRWMLSDLRGAVLSNADLRGASLNSTDLREASFWDSDLRGAYLRDAKLAGTHFNNADLRGAFLESAQLESVAKTDVEIQEEREAAAGWYDEGEEVPDDLVEPRIGPADLTETKLRDAVLSEARLTDVVGLRSDALAGTVLTNTKLPPDIAKFELLDHVTEISKSAGTTFIAMIAACAYSLLTVATTDIGGTGTVTLPIFDTEISVAGFFIVAPLVLVGVYVYLHMYLLRLWQGLGTLPARFPDGRSLDEKAYPWLVTASLVQFYVPKLRHDRMPLWWLQLGISIVTAWLLVPATVIVYSAVVLASGRLLGGLALAVIAFASVILAWLTFDLARRHLTGRVTLVRTDRPDAEPAK